MHDSVLTRFSKSVAARGKYGISWESIIAIILPMVLDCFKSSDAMRSCCENPTPLQQIGLAVRLRRSLRQSGQFRPFQVAQAASDLGDAILAQAKDEAKSTLMAGSDPFADALAEAQLLAG